MAPIRPVKMSDVGKNAPDSGLCHNLFANAISRAPIEHVALSGPCTFRRAHTHAHGAPHAISIDSAKVYTVRKCYAAHVSFGAYVHMCSRRGEAARRGGGKCEGGRGMSVGARATPLQLAMQVIGHAGQ